MGNYDWVPEGIVVQFTKKYIIFRYKGDFHAVYTATRNVPVEQLRKVVIGELERRIHVDRRQKQRNDRRVF